MVQSKVVHNKLGIQAEHDKSMNGLVNHHSPSSFQLQDVKNKGTDLKKKMKKSRSVKKSDFEMSRSSPPLRKEIPQPGKPPPADHHVPTRSAFPQRQVPVKAPESSPNYMKSTSSFEARKEHSQVSSRTPQTPMVSKSLSPKKSTNLRHSTGSGHKAIGTLTRTSSLKRVRTLTKAPSFKPVRTSAKKYSPVVLCENIEVLKPTCSSTLKDSKFPAYLTLSPGATESEGTSVMKVCPYTYCSLNGHHHAPVPPLKGFLAAKRRTLKAQKSIKLGCLSPRRVKPSRDSLETVNDAEHVIFPEKPLVEENNLNSAQIPPPVQEKQNNLFIEIYTNKRLSGTAQCSDIDFEDNLSQNTCATTEMRIIKLTEDQNNEAKEKAYSLPMAEEETTIECFSKHSNSEEDIQPSNPDTDFEDNLSQNICAATEVRITKLTEDQNNEAEEEAYSLPMAEEESTIECFNEHGNSEDIQLSNQLGLSDSEGSEMEWEAGRYYEPSLDDMPIFKLKAIDHHSICDESVSKSDEDISSVFGDIVAEKMLVGFYDEESVSSDVWFNDDDSNLDGSCQNMESDESVLECKEQSQDAYEESTTLDEKGGHWESDSENTTGKQSTLAPTENWIEEFTSASEDKNELQDARDEISESLQIGVGEINCTSEIEEPLADHQENESAQDEYASGLLKGEDFKSSHDSTEQDQDGSYNDYDASHNSIETYLFDSTSENKCSNELSHETKDAEAGKEEHKQEIPTCDTEDIIGEKNGLLVVNSFVGIQVPESLEEMEQDITSADARDGLEEKDELFAAKSSAEIQTFESLQDFPKPNLKKIDEENDGRRLGDVTKESETNQTLVDDVHPQETEANSSDNKSRSNDFKNEDDSKINEDGDKNYKKTNSMNSEDHTYSGAAKLQSIDKDQEADTMPMKVEYTSTLDAEEAFSKAKDASIMGTKDKHSYVRCIANEEMPLACENPSWTIGINITVEESDESRKFNPREPNYLPVEPEPESEKVDLRHQMMDERKNAEEWMIDFALRRVVTNLGPARKRKVALLVEAFEKVLPAPKYESHLSHTSAALFSPRTVQACR